MNQLDFLFKPNSVAVVGVSNDPTKLGSVILSNIIDAGFKGKLYPVNPKYDELFGYKTYKKISDIPGKVDLICVAIPAPFVADTLRDAGKKKVKAAIIITAGFREIGGDGVKMEQEIKEVAKKAGIRLMGPNCLGMINPSANINASFAASYPQDGNIAFLSQSGAFCTAVLDMSLEKQVGFSHFVSLGNKADINENDLIDYWMKDEKVKVIGAYLEEIKQGQTLLDLVQKNNNSKPIVIFKPGETQEAKQAISSHTGSMAGSSQTFKTAVAQNGLIEVNEVNEMFNMMMGFSWANPPKGKRIAVVTNAGGPGIIATDEIVKNGLEMAKISDETKAAIKDYLPATASLHNPIDVIGDALAERYRAPIDVLVNDENVDAILILLTPQLVTQIEETAKLVVNSAKLSKKPIFTVFLGGKYVQHGLQRLYDNKVPSFRYISDAVNVLKAMYEYNRASDVNKTKTAAKTGIMKHASKGKYRTELRKHLTDQQTALPEKVVEKIAKEVGLRLPEQTVCSELKDALIFAKNMYPVVIKATTNSIAHKTEEKALYLNIQNQDELKAAFEELTATIRKHTRGPVEILVQEQVISKEELLIGANRDGGSDVYEDNTDGFGHLLVFGKGGIYTEIYKDIESVLAPATREEIEEAFNKTRISKIINGARGQEKLAMDKVIDAVEAVQKMVILYPEIASLDINPLLITRDKAVAVDLKVFISR